MLPCSPRRACQRGFTVIEMMTTVTVVALLIAVVSPAVGNYAIKAKLAALKMNCRVVQSVITGYSTEHNGELPTSRAQYASSPTYQQLTNPFVTGQAGIGTWGNAAGASNYDNADPQAPVAIWNVDPQTLVMANAAGVAFYVPFRSASEAQDGANGLSAGGDGGSSGHTAYTIQALSTLDTSGAVVPYGDSRVTNW